MKIKLNTEYSEKELNFLKKHNCEILSEIKLPNHFDDDIPIRMFIYYGSYIGEINDAEDGLVWAALGKKGWGECYADFESLEEGL